MKTRSYLLILAAGVGVAASTGCFPGIGNVPGKHSGNDAPIVVAAVQTQGNPAFVSLDVGVEFTIYDPDSDSATLWDPCPYPGANPILKVAFSENGGAFQPIDPAHLTLDGAPLTVPTCSEASGFDESIRIAASTSGSLHTIIWDSTSYVPASADVVFRIAVNDNSFTSEPGDAEFLVANLAAMQVGILGIRPNETITGVELNGILTNWDGTTVLDSSDEIAWANLNFTSATEGTADLTHSGDTEQRPRYVALNTPGAAIGGGDEIASDLIWTCPDVGAPVVEFETDIEYGGISQFVCDQGSFEVEGGLDQLDQDTFAFVAGTDGNGSFSLDWGGGSGDVDDYDAYLIDPEVGLTVCEDDLLACGCASIAKPESCAITGLVAGRTYVLIVTYYAGGSFDYTATINGP